MYKYLSWFGLQQPAFAWMSTEIIIDCCCIRQCRFYRRWMDRLPLCSNIERYKDIFRFLISGALISSFRMRFNRLQLIIFYRTIELPLNYQEIIAVLIYQWINQPFFQIYIDNDPSIFFQIHLLKFKFTDLLQVY